MDDTELRELFEKKLDKLEVIYWVGGNMKKGLFHKRSKAFAVTDKRVMISSGGKTESIPLGILKDETYTPPAVKNEEDVMSLEDFYTVHFENGGVVFRDADDIDTYIISCDNAREAFELIKTLCFKQTIHKD